MRVQPPKALKRLLAPVHRHVQARKRKTADDGIELPARLQSQSYRTCSASTSVGAARI